MSAQSRLFLLIFACLIGLSQTAFIIRGGGGTGGGGTGGGGGGPGTTLATMPLINDGGSATAAGEPTPVFGWVFNQGDIPAGTAPQFVDGVSALPFSASPTSLRSYWSDGSLRFASFSVRAPAVSGNATKNITVKSGGLWPTMGAGSACATRTATELNNQSVALVAPSAAITGSNVSATIGGYLDTTDANAYKIVKWLDGDAGCALRVSTHMSTSHGGAADARMVADHYVFMLTDGSGNLGGFRYLPVLRQPFFDGTTGQIKTFAAPNSGSPTSGTYWTANATARAPYWPFTSAAFTTTSGASATNAANNYYHGGGGGTTVGCAANIVPGYTSGGSLPAQLSSWGQNPLFAVGCGGSNTTQFYSTGQGLNPIVTTGNGSGTFNPSPVVVPFGRVWFAASDAKYNFFQGTGSLTADSTLRVAIDQTYWQKSKVFPPFDLSLCGSNPTVLCPSGAGPITDTTYNYGFSQYSIGNSSFDMSASGDHADIGVLQTNHVTDFYNQGKLDDTLIRIDGFSAAAMPFDFKDSTNDRILDHNFNNGGSYGLKVALTGSTTCWDGKGTGTGSGWTPPSGSVSFPVGVTISVDHEPEYDFWAYARTGELQFWDMLSEQAQMSYLVNCDNSYTSGGPVYDYVITAWDSDVEYRAMGWLARNVSQAAMLAPFDPTNPTALAFDGSKLGKYWNDQSTGNAAYPVIQYNYTCAFTGSITSSVLTVSATSCGVGSVPITGAGINAGTTITTQLSGAPQSTGTYQLVNNAGSLPNVGSETITAATYGAQQSYVASVGLWNAYTVSNSPNCQGGRAPPCYMHDGPMWEKNFVGAAIATDYARTGASNSKSFLADIQAKWMGHILNTFGGYALYHYYDMEGPQWGGQFAPPGTTECPLDGHAGPRMNASDDEFFVSATNAFATTGIGWGVSRPHFAFTSSPQNGYTPANGDKYELWCGAFGNTSLTAPSVMRANTAYYLINVSGSNFDLTTVKGDTGHIIDPVDTGGGLNYFQYLPDKANAPSLYAAAFANETWGIALLSTAWTVALGADNTNNDAAAVLADVLNRLHNNLGFACSAPCGVGTNGGFYQPTYGGIAGQTVDARYALQNHFGP